MRRGIADEVIVQLLTAPICPAFAPSLIALNYGKQAEDFQRVGIMSGAAQPAQFPIQTHHRPGERHASACLGVGLLSISKPLGAHRRARGCRRPAPAGPSSRSGTPMAPLMRVRVLQSRLLTRYSARSRSAWPPCCWALALALPRGCSAQVAGCGGESAELGCPAQRSWVVDRSSCSGALLK